jgi:hypothetical protein
VELLSAALKFNPKIKGISINNSEFLISQYADHSTLSLADDENSLNEVLNMISLFSICSGLRANFDKTQVVWIGARQGCGLNLKQIQLLNGIILAHLNCSVFNILLLRMIDT